MNIEKELAAIVEKKDGNKEIALFHDEDGWLFYLGNPTNCVMLGEVAGEIVVEGKSLEDAINKMKQKRRNNES